MARKLKLDLEKLSVESFDVARAPRERGTVLGKSGETEYNSYDWCGYTEPGSDSYGENTCGWTCSIECQGMSMGSGFHLTNNDNGFC